MPFTLRRITLLLTGTRGQLFDLVFLEMHGERVVDSTDLDDMMVAIAEGRLGKDEVAAILKTMATPAE